MGKDVTADFPDAADCDFRVFKNAEGFSVVDADEPKVVLNKTRLTTARQVNRFIATFLSNPPGGGKWLSTPPTSR